MPIQLGDVILDERKIFKQLRYDMRDDWFPDPRGFKDVLETGVVAQLIQSNFAENHGQYLPQKRHLFDIPKPDFTLRYALETSLPDRVLYHGLVAYLVPFYDRLLPWNACSHPYDPANNFSARIFKAPVQAWRDFVGVVRSSLTVESYLVSTDISNYYENVDLGLLQGAMVELIGELEATPSEQASIRAHISLLFRCLAAWCHEPNRGLPQNRDASSFLANIYMLQVDRGMRSRGYSETYFRYMDDIKIICEDKFKARRALKQMILLLRDVRLSLNSKKTALCQGSDTQRISDILDEGSADLQHLHTMWKTRSREVIKRSIPLLKSFTLRLIRDGATHKREFRYCLRRLEFLGLCVDFAVPDEFFADVTPAIITAIEEHPACTDQFVQYLRAVPVSTSEFERIVDYLVDPNRAVYSWQNYLLWCLLAHKSYKTDRLVACASSILDSTQDDANRAGATIYAGCSGGDKLRVKAAKNFDSLKSFIGQRSALIAIHELHFRPVVEKYVRPHVRHDLKGVYAKLRERPGRYFEPSEAVSITTFVDLDRGYD